MKISNLELPKQTNGKMEFVITICFILIAASAIFSSIVFSQNAKLSSLSYISSVKSFSVSVVTTTNSEIKKGEISKVKSKFAKIYNTKYFKFLDCAISDGIFTIYYVGSDTTMQSMLKSMDFSSSAIIDDRVVSSAATLPIDSAVSHEATRTRISPPAK